MRKQYLNQMSDLKVDPEGPLLDKEDQEENPFLDNNGSSDVEEADKETILSLEERRKKIQSKIGKKQGITIAMWNIRGKKND
jgi:hypothetical protein